MKEGEFCKQCDTALMDVDFNKVRYEIKDREFNE